MGRGAGVGDLTARLATALLRPHARPATHGGRMSGVDLVIRSARVVGPEFMHRSGRALTGADPVHCSACVVVDADHLYRSVGTVVAASLAQRPDLPTTFYATGSDHRAFPARGLCDGFCDCQHPAARREPARRRDTCAQEEDMSNLQTVATRRPLPQPAFDSGEATCPDFLKSFGRTVVGAALANLFARPLTGSHHAHRSARAVFPARRMDCADLVNPHSPRPAPRAAAARDCRVRPPSRSIRCRNANGPANSAATARRIG